jgi:hypothetical protein
VPFEALVPEQPSPGARDELDQAQLRLLGLWKQKQLVSRRLLGYDTTNFYTYIASPNTQNHLAQRGHNKQGRHNLRQVGLSYVLDGEHGLSLCHHVYAGDTPDVEEFSIALARMLGMLDQNQIARDTVTLVFDKGSAPSQPRWLGRRQWDGSRRYSGIRPPQLVNGGRTSPQRRSACACRGRKCWCGEVSLRGEVLGVFWAKAACDDCVARSQYLRRLSVDLRNPGADGGQIRKISVGCRRNSWPAGPLPI